MPSMFAARITSFSPITANVDNLIESGRPIYVHGIQLSTASTDSAFSIRDGSGTLIATVNVSNASSPYFMSIPFLADKGLSFRSTAAVVSVVVFHSNVGG